MAWRLRPAAGEGPPIELPEGTTTVGRDAATCDVVLSDPAVSKCHCRFHASADELVVEDLGSANGTWANGRRVQRSALKAGDELRLASVVYLVEPASPRADSGKPAGPERAASEDFEIVAEEDGSVVGGTRPARLDDTQEFRDSASSVRLIEPPQPAWKADPDSFSNVELLSDSQVEEGDGRPSVARSAPDEESASNVVLLSDDEAEESLSNVRLLSDSQLEFVPEEPRRFTEDPARVVDDDDLVEAADEPSAATVADQPSAHTVGGPLISEGLRDPRSGRPVGLDSLADSGTLDAIQQARQEFLRRAIEAMRAESFAVWEHGQELGPISYEELKARAVDGRLFRGEYVRVQSTGRWVSSERLVGLFADVDERWLERHRRHWDSRWSEGATESGDATVDPLRPFDEEHDADGSRDASREEANARRMPVSLEEIRRRGEAWYDADLWGGGGEKTAPRDPAQLSEWLRRHLWKLVGAFVLVMLGLYFLMPTGDEDLLRELEAIHADIVRLREEKAGARQWKAFAFRVRQRVRPVREILEATAGPEHPAREHMLKAVRDYLPLMLDDARGRPSNSERWYLFHLEQARRTVQGLPTLEKPPGLQPVVTERPQAVGAAGEKELAPTTNAPRPE